MIRKVTACAFVVCGAALGFIAGCGDAGSGHTQTLPATGILTVAGKPIEGATVTFTPDNDRAATGVTDSEGKFTLQTFGTDDGAVVGTHKVSVTYMSEAALESSDPEALEAAANAPNPVPEEFGDPETSGLTREVKAAGENYFELEL